MIGRGTGHHNPKPYGPEARSETHKAIVDGSAPTGTTLGSPSSSGAIHSREADSANLLMETGRFLS